MTGIGIFLDVNINAKISPFKEWLEHNTEKK